MSDNIPFEIQSEIMKMLPVKSLIQFRSVSKPWKSLIDSSRFIADYSGQVQQLLLSFKSPGNYERKYVSIVDDETFPHQKVSITVPTSLKKLMHARIIGTSHGLLCLYNSSSRDGRRRDVVVLWNPCIRKAIAVGVPNVGVGIYGTAIGFGVCCETNDVKIVKISYVDRRRWAGDIESITCIPYQVEVFTLSTGAWRNSNGNLPRKSIHFRCYDEVVINGVFYWLVIDRIAMGGECELIVSFDVTSEEFTEITFPDSLTYRPNLLLSLSKLNESLVVLEYDESVMEDFVVWVMVDGVPKSFTKLFTITPNRDVLVAGFRKSGEPIIEFQNRGDAHSQVAVYEPYSEHIDNLGIDGIDDSVSYPYMETLLLLDQPNFMVYNGIFTFHSLSISG